MIVLGTRPQIIKSAPIIHAAEEIKGIDLQIVHTGQHYDYEMSKAYLDEMKLPTPSANLDVGSGTHVWQTAEIMRLLEKVILNMRPHYVLVPGDTNSALAGALAAAKIPVRVAHVEAGARTYDMSLPEEINRVLTDHCSNLLFAPTRNCWSNLVKEGIPRRRVLLRGDTHYDAFCSHVNQITKQKILSELDTDRPLVYATVHRAENVDNHENLRGIVDGFLRLKKLRILFAVHPRTRHRLLKWRMLRRLAASGHVNLLSPTTYLQSLALAWQSSVVITDSGGLQREAYWLGKPCIIMRKKTEWPETLGRRRCVLAPPCPEIIVKETYRALSYNAGPKEDMPCVNNRNFLFGDGHAAQKILNDLKRQVET
jgi:UDP-N-acetylglucosamine 2-epimerase